MKERINVSIEKGTISKFDKISTDMSRSAYVNKLMNDEIERRKPEEVVSNATSEKLTEEFQALVDNINNKDDILKNILHITQLWREHYPVEFDRVNRFLNIISSNTEHFENQFMLLNTEIRAIEYRLEEKQ